MKIKQLLESLDGISCNSKEVKDNYLFVAIKGSRQDGNKFIDEAVRRGAKVVVAESSGHQATRPPAKVFFIKVKNARKSLAKLAAEFYGHPYRKIKVVGVTGTNGKTTITYLLEAILERAGKKPAVIGTINYRFQNKVIPSKNTTPAPIELQSMLAQMVGRHMHYAVIEVSSHALDQERVGAIDFHSAIFTNLTQDHLDYHKTKEKYFQAKAKLFKNLKTKAFAVINRDDRYAGRLERLTKAKVITYGIENRASVTAQNIKFGITDTHFQLITPRGKVILKTRLIGRHNVYNILAAVAWALKAGISLSVIKSAIEEFRLVPGRLERINSAGEFTVFVDYAHTEDALKNAIGALRGITEKKIIVVFGCGGERDKTKRPKMGRVVSELADYAVITSDNPRSEDPALIIRDIEKGIRKNNYTVLPERQEAIRKSLSLAGDGDIVLVAGKGHETYQVLKNRTIHFDDREAVRECLKSGNY